VFADDFGEVVEDGFQALRQRTVRRFDAAAGDVGEPAAGLGDDAKAGDAQAGVDA